MSGGEPDLCPAPIIVMTRNVRSVTGVCRTRRKPTKVVQRRKPVHATDRAGRGACVGTILCRAPRCARRASIVRRLQLGHAPDPTPTSPTTSRRTARGRGATMPVSTIPSRATDRRTRGVNDWSANSSYEWVGWRSTPVGAGPVPRLARSFERSRSGSTRTTTSSRAEGVPIAYSPLRKRFGPASCSGSRTRRCHLPRMKRARCDARLPDEVGAT